MDFGTERWVDAGDVPLFVRSWGGDGGRDVLYWHGVGLSSQGSLKLADAAPQLARKHGLRVLALDAPGFGRSPARDPDSYHPPRARRPRAAAPRRTRAHARAVHGLLLGR